MNMAADKPAVNNEPLSFSDLQQLLIGPNKRPRDRVLLPVTLGGHSIKTKEELMIENAMESCAFKATLSGVMGFGLGAALGLFSASVGPDATMQDPAQQTVKAVFKDMGTKSFAYAKNFAVLGLMFAATECAIESVSIKLSFIASSTDCVYLFSIEQRQIGRMEHSQVL